jgi:DNA polymerase-3 subunit delta
VILKSYIVEQDVSVLNKFKAFLFYGENDGVKDDVKHQLKQINKNQEIITFFESEILKNRNILYENIINESLFSEKKIIFIYSTTDKIYNEISEGLKKNNPNIKICIFADILDKRSKLRTLFEKEEGLAIIPCYEDNDRTLINYISKQLTGFKGITGELINLIITNSSSNRKVIQTELTKVKEFFSNKIINKSQLLEILNIKNNSNFDEIRDNVLIGKKDKTNRLLSEIDFLQEDSFLYLNSLNYRILKLIEIKKTSKEFSDDEETLNKIKPPIFWKDKPIYLQQLKKWDLKKLVKAANEIGETEVLMKKNSQIRNDIIIKDLLIKLSM